MRAKPVIISGVVFRQVRESAHNPRTWVDDATGLLRVRPYQNESGRNSSKCYEASVHYTYIMGDNQKPKRFHNRQAAMRAAVKAGPKR